MNKTPEPERVITIVVRNEPLQLELTIHVGQDVDILITPDNPRWGVMMELLGERLQAGPIVCKSESDVDRLISRIKNAEPFAVSDHSDSLCFDEMMLHDPEAYLCSPDIHERFDYVSHRRSIPFHQKLNQQANRPGREGKKPKVSRRSMRGKKK